MNNRRGAHMIMLAGLLASTIVYAGDRELTTCPTITVTITSSTNELCYGNANGMATASASGGIAPYTYSWSSGASGVTATNLPAGNYTVTATDNNGCTGDTTVIIGEPPPLTITSAKAFPASCYGLCNGFVVLYATGGTPVFGGYYENWSGGSPDNLCPGTYSVVVTDANGCTIDTGGLVVTSPPQLISSVTSSVSQALCIGQSTSLAGTTSGGIPGYTYSWAPAASLSCPMCNSVIASPSITTTYVETVTDSNGCQVTDTVAVPVNLPITVTIAGNDSICRGTNTILTANASGGDSNYTFLWQPGGIAGANIVVSPATSTTYTAIVNDGCSTPNGVDSFKVHIDTIPFTELVYKDSIMSGAMDTIKVVTFYGANYVWSGGLTGSPVEVNPLVTTTYSVVITYKGGCVLDTSLTIHVLPASVDDMAAQFSGFSCYPNPFSTYCTLMFNSECMHHIEVDDMSGRKVESTACICRQYELPRDGLVPGIYFVRVYDEGQTYAATTRVVVK